MAWLGGICACGPKALRAEGSLSFSRFPLSLVAPLGPNIPWHEPEKTMLSASLELKEASATHISVSGTVGVTGAALFSERIAPGPVRGINIEIEGKGSWSPTERLLKIDEARAQTGGVSRGIER